MLSIEVELNTTYNIQVDPDLFIDAFKPEWEDFCAGRSIGLDILDLVGLDVKREFILGAINEMGVVHFASEPNDYFEDVDTDTSQHIRVIA